MSDWDAKQYMKFLNERTQPAIDLLNRININDPKKIIDIGCGPGNSTDILKRRLPQARIIGIDNSSDMLEKAKKEYTGLEFLFCDAGKDLDKLDKDFDIVFSNACIQWIPDHNRLIKNMAGLLKKGGILAVQVPVNYDEPVHRITGKISQSDKWALKINNARNFYTLSENDYYDLLSDISGNFSIWRTTYFHKMKSHNDIIEWYKSTGLKPYLDRLSQTDKIEFTGDVYKELSKEYPLQKNGDIIFRFPRLFFIVEI